MNLLLIRFNRPSYGKMICHSWVCCWFSPLLWEIFLRLLQFFPSPQKPSFPNSNLTMVQVDEEPPSGANPKLSSVFFFSFNIWPLFRLKRFAPGWAQSKCFGLPYGKWPLISPPPVTDLSTCKRKNTSDYSGKSPSSLYWNKFELHVLWRFKT